MKYFIVLVSSIALQSFSHTVCSKEILPSAENHQKVVLIAKKATIMFVDSNQKSEPKKGSGVIIQKKGNLYTVITNRHVICGSGGTKTNTETCSMPNPYNLVTADGQRHSINSKKVLVLSGGLDLAIVQFKSNQNYAVGKLANSDSAPIGTQIYTVGYDSTTMKFVDDDGSVMANSSHINDLSDKNGYGIIYNAYTNKGMSGSAIWNRQGEIVAIHGRGLRYEVGSLRWLEVRDSETDKVSDKYGWNIGIPVNRFIKELGATDNSLVPNYLLFIRDRKQIIDENDYYLSAVSLAIKPEKFTRDKQNAIGYLSKAISLRKSYSYAYFLIPGLCDDIFSNNMTGGEIKEACDKLEIETGLLYLHPSSSKDYVMRGKIYEEEAGVSYSSDDDLAAYDKASTLTKQAFSDYEKAIIINAKYSTAYVRRGTLRQKDNFGDYSGALADYDQALLVSPQSIEGYSARALLKEEKLEDLAGALSDCNKAISFNTNPNNYSLYTQRSSVKKKMNDISGAIYDLRLAYERSKGRMKQWIWNDLTEIDQDTIVGTEIINLASNIRGKSIKDLLLSAKEKRETDRCSEAIADYNSILSINNKIHAAHIGRAECGEIISYPTDAVISDYDNAILLNPQSSAYYLSRAKYRYSDFVRGSRRNNRKSFAVIQSAYKNVLDDYSKGIALDRKVKKSHKNEIASIYSNRGYERVERGDFQLALDDYNKAIVINPNNADFYLRRGRLKAEKLNNRTGAIEDITQALKIFRADSKIDPLALENITEQLRKLKATEERLF